MYRMVAGNHLSAEIQLVLGWVLMKFSGKKEISDPQGDQNFLEIPSKCRKSLKFGVNENIFCSSGLESAQIAMRVPAIEST